MNGKTTNDGGPVACLEFEEHPGWRDNPDGGVTWDGWCSECGFRVENRPFTEGMAIEGSGRKLGYVRRVLVDGGEVFVSEERRVVCSECNPRILRGNHELGGEGGVGKVDLALGAAAGWEGISPGKYLEWLHSV
jgi:hypothetical protein